MNAVVPTAGGTVGARGPVLDVELVQHPVRHLVRGPTQKTSLSGQATHPSAAENPRDRRIELNPAALLDHHDCSLRSSYLHEDLDQVAKPHHAGRNRDPLSRQGRQTLTVPTCVYVFEAPPNPGTEPQSIGQAVGRLAYR